MKSLTLVSMAASGTHFLRFLPFLITSHSPPDNSSSIPDYPPSQAKDCNLSFVNVITIYQNSQPTHHFFSNHFTNLESKVIIFCYTLHPCQPSYFRWLFTVNWFLFAQTLQRRSVNSSQKFANHSIATVVLPMPNGF